MSPFKVSLLHLTFLPRDGLLHDSTLLHGILDGDDFIKQQKVVALCSHLVDSTVFPETISVF